MKILIVNDKLQEGGAEIYVKNLINLLQEENEVYLMSFDNKFDKDIELKNNFKIINIKPHTGFLRKINKIMFNPILYLKIRRDIKKINPDRIILNNIFYNPITQIKALKNYDVYQVIHDYSIVCPKKTCMKPKNKKCNGYKEENCLKECNYHGSKVNIFLRLLFTKKMEKLRKKIIKKLIAPSENLYRYLLRFNYNSICINNPIDVQKFKNNNKNEKLDKNIKTYIYVGSINEIKGIFKLMEYFNIFAKDKNVKLNIIGRPTSKSDKEELERKLKIYKKINYLGSMNNEDALKEIANSYCIIVPSICMENYPTTVLEGMLSKTLVVASNNGGMKDMLAENRGFIFDIFDREKTIETLDKSFSLSKKNYEKIVENAYKYTIENNSFSTYKKKLYKNIEIGK